MFYIDPNECIDCGACVSTCPVEAIFAEADVPAQWKEFTAKNKEMAAKGPVA
jgi:ferredoxin